MYRMAMLAMVMDPVPSVDMGKVMRMCLVHDLAETRIGDITPYDGVSAADKHRLETDAMASIASLLRPESRLQLVQLFDEYEAHESPEARLTKDLDLFDMIQQAFEYEKDWLASPAKSRQQMPDLQEFFTHTTRISNPQVQSWCLQLLRERKQLLMLPSTSSIQS